MFWKFHNYNYNIDMRIFRTINVMTIKKRKNQRKMEEIRIIIAAHKKYRMPEDTFCLQAFCISYVLQ